MKAVGVIGPTDLGKLCFLLEKPLEFVLERAALIGRILAENDCEVLVNADGGMLAAVAKSYKDHDGRKLVVLVPRRAGPWPIDHTVPYTEIADEVMQLADWFRTNRAVVSLPTLVVCVGLSAGTFSELSYIKWDDQHQKGNLEKLVVIQELVRGGVIPPELAINIAPMLEYVNVAEELDQILKRIQCRELASA